MMNQGILELEVGRDASSLRMLEPSSSTAARLRAPTARTPREAGVAPAPRHCPVTRQILGGSGPDAVVQEVLRLPGMGDATAATTILTPVSRAAAEARAGAGFVAVFTQWRHLQTGHAAQAAGLNEREWLRWAVLLSFVTPLPAVEVARLPMVVLPPAGVPLIHPLQRLQRLITRQLATSGWSLRLRQLAEPLAQEPMRHDFQCFVAALAPRVLELPDATAAGTGDVALRHALEDLWRDRSVQRRWQHLAIQLGQEGAERLLRHAGRCGLDESGGGTSPRAWSSRAVGSAGTTFRPASACDRPRKAATRTPRWLTTMTS